MFTGTVLVKVAAITGGISVTATLGISTIKTKRMGTGVKQVRTLRLSFKCVMVLCDAAGII